MTNYTHNGIQLNPVDRPDFCVIAQHYPSATFVTLSFRKLNEKFGARFKHIFDFLKFGALLKRFFF